MLYFELRTLTVNVGFPFILSQQYIKQYHQLSILGSQYKMHDSSVSIYYSIRFLNFYYSLVLYRNPYCFFLLRFCMYSQPAENTSVEVLWLHFLIFSFHMDLSTIPENSEQFWAILFVTFREIYTSNRICIVH